MSKTTKLLTVVYYIMMGLALLVAGGMYYLIMHDIITVINPYSTCGQAIQYAIILDALVTIPGGLYLFKRQCERLSQLSDPEQQHILYRKYGTWRIVLVSNTMVLGVAAFYLLGAYRSMIWLAAISAIGWYFTKPTDSKMQHELTPRDPNQETY